MMKTWHIVVEYVFAEAPILNMQPYVLNSMKFWPLTSIYA